MKVVYIFPPLWDTSLPSIGIPALMGLLSDNGVNCIAYDLNIDFFNFVFSSDYINKSIGKIQNILKNKDNLYSTDAVNYIQTEFNKYIKFLNNKDFDKFIQLIKIKKYYKDYKFNMYDSIIRESVLNIVSLPYYPFKLNFINYYNTAGNNNKNDYSVKKELVNDKKHNIFYEFFEKKLPEININNNDLVCVSINSIEQLLGALTIIKLIKEQYNVKIQIGGTWADLALNQIKNDKELFDLYFDYCMVGIGENATKELWEYHIGQRKIENVSNILYLRNGEICQNTISNNISNKPCKYNYNGFDFKKYFIPDIILPIRVSHGCYWGKCTFCNYNYNKKYFPKSADSVISEIEELMEKYNARYFYFQDSALTPKFIEEFADKIIKKKLNIRYMTNLRLEKEFNKKLLKKLYKSGLRIVLWGLESASPKILKKMNKGIEVDSAKEILKNANNVGIFNHLYLIYNFPGETMEDFYMTVNFIKKYSRKYFYTFAYVQFTLTEGTYIYNNPEEFNISHELLNDNDFYSYNTGVDFVKKYKIVQDLLRGVKTFYSLCYMVNLSSILPLLDNIPVKYFKYIDIFIIIKEYLNFKYLKKSIMKKFVKTKNQNILTK